MSRKYKLKGNSRDSYLECLSKYMPLTSIKDHDHLAYASQVVDELISIERDAGEEEYLQALTDLIESYEAKALVFPQSSAAEMLAHLIKARGITQATVAKAARVSRSTISEILSGKDRVSKNIALKLADYFEVSPVLFLNQRR